MAHTTPVSFPDRKGDSPLLFGFVEKRIWLKQAAIIFACWIPGFVLMFPGIIEFDALASIQQLLGFHPIDLPVKESGATVIWNARFTDHKPFFTTILFGVLPGLSLNLFGNATPGVAATVILQMAGMAATFALCARYAERLGLSRKVSWAVTLCFALFPPFAFNAVTLINDISFSAVFLLWLMVVTECVVTKARCFDERRWCVAFAVLGCLLALTKKPGVYLVVLTALVILIVYRRQHHAGTFLVSAGCAGLLVWFILPVLVFPPLNVVTQTGTRETLGVLVQQTARYVVYHGDEVTDGEREAIDRVLDYGALAERYDEKITDPVKDLWSVDASTEDTFAYLQAWAAEGAKHPETYCEATTRLCGDFLSLTAPYKVPASGNTLHLIQNAETAGSTIDLGQPESMRPARDAAVNTYKAVSTTLPFSIPLSMGLFVFWIPIACFLIVMVKGRGRAWVFVPMFISFPILMVSPVAHARYALPFLFAAPLLICLAASVLKVPRETPAHIPEEVDAL